MGNRGHLAYALGLALGIAAALPVRANDLLSAYQAALDRDVVLQSAGYQRAAAVEVRPQALAQFLPQLSATANINGERLAYHNLDGNSVNTGTSSNTKDATAWGSARSYGLSLSQTLWSTQSFHLLAEADLQVAEAEAAYRGAQQALVIRVAQAYFDILSAADAVTTNRSEREAFGALLHQAQVREQTGVGPRSDVAQAQSFYDATEQPLIDAETALEDARRALAEITGRYPDSIAPLQERIPLAAPQPASPDDWVTAASDDNFDVRAAQLKADAALRDVSVQKAKRLPTLALSGAATVQQQSPALGVNEDLGSVGVVLNWPLFQGGTVASFVRQSQALYQQANADLEGVRRATERQTRAAFRGITSGISRIQAAQRAAESSAAAVEASRRNIEFGTGSEFDLLNAQNNYYTALRAFRQSRYDYLTQVLALKQQAGRLGEEDLDGIDGLLVAGNATAASDSDSLSPRERVQGEGPPSDKSTVLAAAAAPHPQPASPPSLRSPRGEKGDKLSDSGANTHVP